MELNVNMYAEQTCHEQRITHSNKMGSFKKLSLPLHNHCTPQEASTYMLCRIRSSFKIIFTPYQMHFSLNI